MTAVRESLSPSSTTTGIPPGASSQSTECSSVGTSQPSDSDIPPRDGTIIEENQSTYLVAWSGAEVPTEVPKESVPEGITKKWNALKAAMLLPPEDMRHGKSGGIETNHHAPVDFDAEAPGEAGNDLIRQPHKRRKVAPINRQASWSSGSRTGVAKADDPVITNASTEFSPHISPHEDHSNT